MLYGGLGGDGKPANDAWMLDINKPSWTCLYSATPDIVHAQVNIFSLLHKRFVILMNLPLVSDLQALKHLHKLVTLQKLAGDFCSYRERVGKMHILTCDHLPQTPNPKSPAALHVSSSAIYLFKVLQQTRPSNQARVAGICQALRSLQSRFQLLSSSGR